MKIELHPPLTYTSVAGEPSPSGAPEGASQRKATLETPHTEVCVIGLGAVGLPLAALFAHAGVSVCGVDLKEDLVHQVERGHCEGAEPGLDQMIHQQRAARRLRASTRLPVAQTYILATPTLSLETPDPYAALGAAIDALLPVLPPGALVVVESTCAPGSLEGLLLEPLRRTGRAIGRDVFVAHCPERVLPGRALEELAHAPRVVAGHTQACAERARALYARLGAPVHMASSIDVAQAAKLVENAQREMNIAFSNHLADWARAHDLNVRDVIDAANTHPRVDVLRPGVGAGGRCLPLATSLLTTGPPEQMSLLRATADYHRQLGSELAARALGAAARPRDLTVALLGASYKPDVPDTRDSPTAALKRALERDERVACVRVSDPLATSCLWASLTSLERAIDGADVLICCVAHEAYTHLPDSTLSSLRGAVIADYCAGLPPHWSRIHHGPWLHR